LTPSDGHKTTILVVDDEPAILRLLVEALNGPTLSLLTTTMGNKAIELYRQDPSKIDLVLLDLQMQPLSGLQILAELRLINPQVRVAFMSGSPSETPPVEMQDAEVVPVFPKPFMSLTNLAAALQKLAAPRS
jgi:two-component system, cell cycle sensor histidine kinase and response regulator CckA